MTAKDNRSLVIWLICFVIIIGVFALFWWVYLNTCEVSDEKFPMYTLLYLLKFWSDSGFTLVFGYVALFAVVPSITMKWRTYYEFIQKKLMMLVVITFYMVISLLSSLFYPCLERVSGRILETNYEFATSILLTVTNGILLVATFGYAVFFIFTLYVILRDMKTPEKGEK